MEIAVFCEFIRNAHGYFLLILALAPNYPLIPYPLSILFPRTFPCKWKP